MKTKLLSLLLALALALSLCPAALAAGVTVDEAAQAVCAYLYEAVPAPGVDAIGGDWVPFAMLRCGWDVPEDYLSAYLERVEAAVTAKEGVLHPRKYSDNSIEIEALRKQQDRLLEMMDAAQTVEEMIMVEERLSEVQVELNRKLSYQSSMDTDVKYSTIYLNISEVQEYTPGDNKVQIGGFWKRLADAADNSWRSFVYFLQGLVIGLVNLLPFILLIGLIVFGIKRYRKAKGLDTKLFHWKKKGRLSKTEDAPQKAAEPVKEDAEPEDKPETK